MSSNDIYLACAISMNEGDTDYYRKIWRVHFADTPIVQPLEGNETRFIMTLNLEEV